VVQRPDLFLEITEKRETLWQVFNMKIKIYYIESSSATPGWSGNVYINKPPECTWREERSWTTSAPGDEPVAGRLKTGLQQPQVSQAVSSSEVILEALVGAVTKANAVGMTETPLHFFTANVNEAQPPIHTLYTFAIIIFARAAQKRCLSLWIHMKLFEHLIGGIMLGKNIYNWWKQDRKMH
jgi:hypothetical protein